MISQIASSLLQVSWILYDSLHYHSPLTRNRMNCSPITPISTESVNYNEFASESSRFYDALLVEEQLDAMLDQERSYQVTFVPCSKPKSADADADDVGAPPHEGWRRKICEWSYRVVDHFRIEREVVSISMNLFDRYLSTQDKDKQSCKCPSCQRAVDSHTFQLAAMTSLYVAIKVHAESCIHDSSRKKLKLSSMVDLSRGQFSREDICAMELNMLSSLSWKVNPVTPSNLVSYLLRLMPSQSDIPLACRANYDLALHVLNELARYLSELSVCLPSIDSSFFPSEIAFASIMVSIELLGYNALPAAAREDFCSTVSDVLDSKNIPYLMDCLSASFWPEVLLNECGDHPMALARDLGLLDLGRLYSRNEKRPSFGDRSATSVADIYVHQLHHNDDTMRVVSPWQGKVLNATPGTPWIAPHHALHIFLHFDYGADAAPCMWNNNRLHFSPERWTVCTQKIMKRNILHNAYYYYYY